MKPKLASFDLASFLDLIYLPQKLRVRGEKTKSHYRMIVRQLGETIGRPARVSDLRDEIICLYLRRLTDSGLSPHTVQQRRNYVVALANWCSRRGIIGWWVNVERIKTPQLIPRAWTMPELVRLLRACQATPGDYDGVPRAAWWVAFHLVCWDTAERTGAVLAIRDDWFSGATLTVPPEARKGGQKAGIYELKPVTMRALGPLLFAAKCRPDHRVFAFPGCSCSFYLHYRGLLRRAGLPTGPKFGPQRIRRTFATMLEMAGGNATEALLHSCRRVTLESYLDPTQLKTDAPNRLLPPLDAP